MLGEFWLELLHFKLQLRYNFVCSVEFFQPESKFLFDLTHLISFERQQRRVQFNLIEIRLGRGIDPPPQLLIVLLTGARHIHGHRHTHLRQPHPNILLEFNLLKEFRRHRQQCLLRPIGEPIQVTAIHQRRELPASYPQCFSHGRHTQNDVEILANAVDEAVPEGLGAVLDLVFEGVWADLVVDFLEVLLLHVEVGDLAGIQDVVDVLQETLVGDLDVGEDERQLLALATCNLSDSL